MRSGGQGGGLSTRTRTVTGVAGGARGEKLNFDAQAGSFTGTNAIIGATSGATATILSVIDAGTTGTLFLANIIGTFQDNEIIIGHLTGFDPVLGSDLFDPGAGIFTAGTYSWTVYGTNTIANDANTLKITYVDSANGAYNYFRDASDLTSDLTVGNFYRIDFDAKVGAGDSVIVTIATDGTINTTITVTSFESNIVYFVATNATTDHIRMGVMGAGEDIWLDNLVLRQVTNAALANGVVY